MNSAPLITLRLPDGSTEFRSSTSDPPNLGDTLTCRGIAWTVARVSRETDGSLAVTLMPRSQIARRNGDTHDT